MDRTIEVKGCGKISRKPDITKVTITMTGEGEQYDCVVEQSTTQSSELYGKLATIGFNREDLKTQSYCINTKYENVQDELGRWSNKFKGYCYTQVLQLSFAESNELLSKVIYAVVNSGGQHTFDISYAIKDADSACKEMIALAVKDSISKANILASEAGVKLKNIANIEYISSNNSLEVHPTRRMDTASRKATMQAAYAIDIVPDNIVASEVVVIRWTIE